MIIILEGTEGGGKSTLAKKLSMETGWRIEHRSKPQTELERLLMYDDYKATILAGENLIWDRCWYSEMVYGPIMRDQSYINIRQMQDFEKLLVDNGGAMIIYCASGMGAQWQAATQRGEEYVTDFLTFSRLYDKYDELMLDVPHLIPVVQYDLTKNMHKL